MCGRYTLRKRPEEVAISEDQSYRVRPASPGDDFAPRFNIAPTQSNLVLRRNANEWELESSKLRWGLVPSWSKSAQTASPIINARSETVTEKPSFRAAFQRRRCLVPADGFYEWKKSRSGPAPYFFHLKDDSIFYMAGIWEVWLGELGERIESFTILTTHANSLMAKFHDRMPVILAGERLQTWLDNHDLNTPHLEYARLFEPIEPDLMECRPANPVVNNNRSEGPVCLEEPSYAPTSQLDLGL